jgi:putative heme iron utilization protein
MTESPAATVRRLVRSQPQAALGTLERGSGEPYVSLVMVACGHDAVPLLLLSDLADHTKNANADARASLLLDGTLGLEVPLTGARATLQGRIERADSPELLARYTRRHPDALGYAGFADFHLYRLVPRRAHLVAGFGKIHWLDAAAVAFDSASAAPLAAAEAEIVEHMNDDHADAVQLYATALLGLPAGPWTMTGVDPEGADLRAGDRGQLTTGAGG